MKRLVFVLAIVAALIMSAVAVSAPAPKTTGGIGYSIYGVQRSLDFNAIQTTSTSCGSFWNLASASQFTFFLTGDLVNGYTHHVSLSQSGMNGSTVGGSGGYPLTGGDVYHWNVTSGSLVGNTLSLTALYDLGATGTVMHISGTIAADGSISGTWDDNFGGARTGTFTAPAGSATSDTTFCNSKGSAFYSDVQGNEYLVNVRAVDVNGTSAWFAGPVVWSNFGVAPGTWLFAKVTDGGEPGIGHDQVWGSFTDQVTAIAGVTAMATPADGGVYISSGNLQVH
jgi:hypothetical protein